MKQPSIHISEQKLINILRVVLSQGLPEATVLAKQILLHGKKYTLTRRKLLATNQKMKAKAEKLGLTETDKAMLFAKLLTTIRQQRKHRGIQIIKVDSSMWGNIKTLTKLAEDFCESFNLETKTGFTEFINLNLDQLKSFNWNWHLRYNKICIAYEAIKEIKEDDDTDGTHQIFLEYDARIRAKVGSGMDYTKIPEKYVHFIAARKEAKALGIDYKNWVTAQFEGLEWTNGIPEPSSLCGVKAEERLKKYLYENNIKVSANPKATFTKEELIKLGKRK